MRAAKLRASCLPNVWNRFRSPVNTSGAAIVIRLGVGGWVAREGSGVDESVSAISDNERDEGVVREEVMIIGGVGKGVKLVGELCEEGVVAVGGGCRW